MMSIKSNDEASPSSSRPRWKYDVFVSFRGEDTRKNFTDHLCRALDQKGIIFFRDDEKLERGKPIAPELFRAIEESRFSIIVLSRNYATSAWCLDELVKIVECMKEIGQTVVPIFYDVSPTEVRKQTGSFEEAFDKHEKAFGAEKLQKWRAALTEVANLSGWDLQDRHEATFIQEVVEAVWTKLSHSFSSVAKGLVGIDSRLQDMNLCLDLGLNDVRIIGICGMGGIGKSTIAKAVYDQFSYQFQGSSFVRNVRELFAKFGLMALQEQLLCQTLMEKNLNISDVRRGIYTRLRNKRVLIILDDVDKLEQLEMLAGDREWFGPGSRIIVTTRDEHLLIAHCVDIIYKAQSLNTEEALQLFSLKAFKQNYPTKDFVELSKNILSYANGLPLALVVLGSYLCGRSVTEWRSALKRLKETPNREIFDVLKVSYEGLEETEKNIFLDISCFFHLRNNVDRVIEILEAFDFYPEIGIRVLIDKSLVSIEDTMKKLYVHSLLKEMAAAIVHQESPKEPGKRSRLWLYDDIRHVLTKKTGTEVVEVIYRNSSESKEISVGADAFVGMHNLRMLKIHDVNLPKGLDFLPDELRIIKWHGYPLKSLPSTFKAEKLVELNMLHSRIELLWKETLHLDKLKIIKLSHSKKLTRTPDFRGVPSLERLILEGCTSLYEVHPSIADLERLRILNLKDCRNLRSLPRIVSGWRSLKVLWLLGCSKLDKLPENLGDLKCLEELNAGETAITEAPSSIVALKNLKRLSFKGCKGQTHKHWNLFWCLLPGLRPSSVSFSLPSQLVGLMSLTELDLSYCNLSGETTPSDLGNLSTLTKLNLSGNDFVSLPGSISQLSKLKTLQLADCQKLQALTELPSSIEKLISYNCSSLNSLNGPLGLRESKHREFSLQNCFSLVEDQGNNNVALSLLQHHLLLLAKIQMRSILLTLLNFIENSQINNPQIAMLASAHRSIMENLFKEVFEAPSVLPRLVVFLPGGGIPDWFTFQTTFTTIRIELPPNWYNNHAFLGLAICASLEIQEDNNQEQQVQWLPKALEYVKSTSKCDYKCKFYLFSGDRNCLILGKECPLNGNRMALTDHLWLFFIPFDEYFQKRNWSHVEAYFRLEGSGLEFKKCGIRLVHLEDVDFVQEMFKSAGQHFPGMGDLTKLLSLFGQQAASGNGSFPEQPKGIQFREYSIDPIIELKHNRIHG